jgi:methionyl-tRNA formyltransferase
VEVKFALVCSKPWGKVALQSLKGRNLGKVQYIDSKSELSSVSESGDISVFFFIHWNWFIPKYVYENHLCIGFHMTDLPWGRGGSPLQNLISRGFSSTILTAFRITGEMDTGPIILKRELSLHGRAVEIYERMSSLAAEMISEILSDGFQEVPQFGVPVYFQRRNPEESAIPTLLSLKQIYDFIRMLDAPTYPQAFLDFNGFRFEFNKPVMDSEMVYAQVEIRKLDDKHNFRDSR